MPAKRKAAAPAPANPLEALLWDAGNSGASMTPAGSPQGEDGGVHHFYTPSCVVRCLVEMLAPYKSRIYDSACCSGGMFVQTQKLVECHGGTWGEMSICGQGKWERWERPCVLSARARRVKIRRQPKQRNATTRRLAVVNLAMRGGTGADFGPENGDTFRRDILPISASTASTSVHPGKN